MNKGFTLAELLTVIAVLGVVLALGAFTFLNFRQNTQIQEAQTQFTQDLERVRQFARRYSVDYVVKTPSSTEYQAYALKADNTQDTTVPSIVKTKLPNGATFDKTPSSDAKYLGPFGRIDDAATDNCYSIKIASSGKFAEIDLLGVTGRVTPRPIRTTGSACVP